MLDDLAGGRDEERFGIPGRAVAARDRALRIQCDRQARDPALLEPRVDDLPVLVPRDGQEFDVWVVLRVPDEFHELGHLFAARSAPSRPEVQDQALACPRREIVAGAVPAEDYQRPRGNGALCRGGRCRRRRARRRRGRQDQRVFHEECGRRGRDGGGDDDESRALRVAHGCAGIRVGRVMGWDRIPRRDRGQS